MCARLLACPLCSQPGFLTLDALRTGLISVATRPLICPVCNEVLLGIDKLTIHLFSHTINLSNNQLEPSKHINIATNNNNSITIHNLQNTVFQDWNASKVQSIELNKLAENNNLNRQNNSESSKALQTVTDKIPILDSQISIQNKNLPLKNTSQVEFFQNHTCKTGEEAIFHESHEDKRIMLESCKSTEEILPERIKLNYPVHHYSNDNAQHMSLLQCHTQTKEESIQTFKQWDQEQKGEQQYTSIKDVVTIDLNKPSIEAAESHNKEQNLLNNTTVIITNKESKFSNFKSFTNNVPICPDTSLKSYNNEKNSQNNSGAIDDKQQDEDHTKEEILPPLKIFKTLATKDNSDRCNICGFHFPNYNILLLHKQLVHMVDEQNADVMTENLLKSYSCHLCSKVFKMRGSLMVHMRVAHIGYNLGSLPKAGQIQFILNDNGYNCPTCGKKFKKEQHVIQHLKTHEAKQWECDVCSKMFTTKYFLKKHKRLHSGEMPYKCNICNKTFTFQQSYHKHRLYHKDDKPHTCTTCGRSFKELSTLHNHERIHTGEKPFACETCGKCFRQRVSYLVHRRIHTGVMPYKCTMCGKSFRYKVSQRTHKCSAQQVENVQQLSDVHNATNESCETEQNFSQESQPVIKVINNEENKYVLIINTEGQHQLTKESDIKNIQDISNKGKIEEYIATGSENKQLRNIWNSDIPNNTVFKKPIEPPNKVHSQNEKSNQDANDFFSMVMSPLENGLPSPTAEMEHLRVSSPIQKDMLETYINFKTTTDNLQMNIINTNMEQNLDNDNNVGNTLHTINEESLKQLLYGIDDK